MSAPVRRRFGGRVETEPDASGMGRSSGGVGIAWRSYGEGEPVLLVMGFMGSGHAWFRLLPHIAATLGQEAEVARGRAVEAIRRVLDDSPEGVTLLMETTAGQGSAMNRSFDELDRRTHLYGIG